MSLRVLTAMFLAIGALVFLVAVSDENEPTSNPQIIVDLPAQVSAGSCFEGSVEDADGPISVGAVWDDGNGVILNTGGTGGFGGTTVNFEFCTSASDVGRTFTIIATDVNGNFSEVTVTVVL